MSQPTLLLYNFPAKKAAKLRMVAMRLNIRVRTVEKWEYLNCIGAFTGDCAGFDAHYDGEGFPDEMLVMAHYPQTLLSNFLQALRAAKLPPIPLKAVLTKTNTDWNSLELHEQLCEEHAAMQNGTSAHEANE